MDDRLLRASKALMPFLFALLVACGGSDEGEPGAGGSGGGGGQDCTPRLCGIDMCGVHDDGCGGELVCAACLWDTVAELPEEATLLDLEVGPGGVHWLIGDPGTEVQLQRGSVEAPVEVVAGTGWVDLHFFGGEALLVDEAGGAIERVELNERATETVVSGEEAPVLVTVHDDQIVWATATGRVAHTPWVGGEVQTFREGEAGGARPVALFVDDGGLVLVLADGGIHHLAFPEREWTDLSLPGGSTILAAAVDGTHVYLADTERRRIVRVDRSSGVASVVVEGQDVADLAVSGPYVYWATPQGIFRAPSDGGEPTVVIPNRRDVEALVIEAGHLHWVDGGASSGGKRSVLRLGL